MLTIFFSRLLCNSKGSHLKSKSDSLIEKSENSILYKPCKLQKNSKKNAGLSCSSGNPITENTLNTILLKYDSNPTVKKLNPELDLTFVDYIKDDEALKCKQAAVPHKRDIFVELNKRIITNKRPDFTVLIGKEKFDCHRIALQCYSEIFNKYNGAKTVSICSSKCSPTSFASIYEWMIKDQQPYKILSRSNVIDILQSAKFLEIKKLEEQCWLFINNIKVFNEDTAFLLYIEAKHKNNQKIQEVMIRRIQNFFLVLVSSQDWLDLDCEDVIRLLSSNYIKINCEMEIFMAAVRWLQYDWDNRKDLKFKVLDCVRFRYMSSLQLINLKHNPENRVFNELAQDPYICKLIQNALDIASLKEFTDKMKGDLRGNLVLDLEKPNERNLTGVNKTYFTYGEFLKYLDYLRRNELMKKSRSKSSGLDS